MRGGSVCCAMGAPLEFYFSRSMGCGDGMFTLHAGCLTASFGSFNHRVLFLTIPAYALCLLSSLSSLFVSTSLPSIQPACRFSLTHPFGERSRATRSAPIWPMVPARARRHEYGQDDGDDRSENDGTPAAGVEVKATAASVRGSAAVVQADAVRSRVILVQCGIRRRRCGRWR